MKLPPKFIAVIAAVGIVTFWIAPADSGAFGRTRGYGSGNWGNTKTKNNAPQRQPQHANTAEADAARKLNADEAEVAKAQAALDEAIKPLKERFEASPEMVTALSALNEAISAHKTAVAAVAATLQANASFQAAMKKKNDAQSQLDSLRQTSGATTDQITAAATDVMNAGTIATQLQASAESADPTFVQTRADMISADSKVSDLWRQFAASIRTDPQWLAARKTLDDANLKLAEAQTTLAAAQNKERALR